VQGHIDCTTVLQKKESSGKFWNLEFKIPDQFEKYLVEKGSIAIDGISLTIAGINEQSFNISIIPETYSNTNVQYYAIGTSVNVEIDILAKYIEKILRSQTYSNDSKLTADKLKKMGY
jgi:riboflavin synthase